MFPFHSVKHFNYTFASFLLYNNESCKKELENSSEMIEERS